MFPIVEKVMEAKGRKIHVFPCHVNRASQLGHPCLRYLVYCRTTWQERQLHDARTEAIFEGGRAIEEMALRELQEAGFVVTEQQRPFEYKELQITGHVDCRLRNSDGRALPCEIKGLNHYDWMALNSVQDMMNSRKVWIQQYPAQIQLYLLMANEDEGLFYLKDKLTFEPKVIWAKLDYDYAESLLKKAEAVNAHVTEGTLPERVEYQDELCARCSFNHLCGQGRVFGPELEIEDNPVLLEMLEQRAANAEARKLYEEADKTVKKIVEGRPNLLVGDWHITGKLTKRKGYSVPESEYWKVTIGKK